MWGDKTVPCCVPNPTHKTVAPSDSLTHFDKVAGCLLCLKLTQWAWPFLVSGRMQRHHSCKQAWRHPETPFLMVVHSEVLDRKIVQSPEWSNLISIPPFSWADAQTTWALFQDGGSVRFRGEGPITYQSQLACCADMLTILASLFSFEYFIIAVVLKSRILYLLGRC